MDNRLHPTITTNRKQAMKTKDDIIHDLNGNSDGFQTAYPFEEVEKAMDEYAKLRAVEFFKWNAKKAGDYIDYLRRVDKAEGASEKEKELDHFEGATIDGRYELFLQETENQSQNK